MSDPLKTGAIFRLQNAAVLKSPMPLHTTKQITDRQLAATMARPSHAGSRESQRLQISTDYPACCPQANRKPSHLGYLLLNIRFQPSSP